MAGVDLTSTGYFEPASSQDRVIVFKVAQEYRYHKLVISNGKIVGAILLGYPQDAPVVIAAVKKETDVSSFLEGLERGNWQKLNDNSFG